MKAFRFVCFCVAILSASYAGFLSWQVDETSDSGTASRYSDESGVSVSVAIDSAKDGGAAGFAALAGLALIAASITYLKSGL